MSAFDTAVSKRDPRLADSVLHQDFALVLVHPNAATMPRERWLEVLPDYVVHEYEIQEQALDIDDAVAAVLTRVFMRATVLGQPRDGIFAISDFWRQGPEGWRVWRRHSTPLAAGTMPGTR